MSRVLGLTAIAVSLVVGCAPALRPPPELSALVGPVPAGRDAARLEAEAEARYATRDPDEVRQAARRWLEVALLEPQATAPLASAASAFVWLADRGGAPVDRERDALSAVRVSQHCLGRDGTAPACRYALALALGVQARERRATALDALPRIVALLEGLTDDSPSLDRGGPHRVLALVLLRAPGWPTGPGDPDRGLEEALAAVAVDDAYPPNLLAWAEAVREVEGREAAGPVYRRALAAAETAREAGEPDAGVWADEARAGLDPGAGR